MTRFKSAFLAAASACLIGSALSAARPHYGGTMRIETSGVIRAMDPSASPASPADTMTARRAFSLVFETLVAVDPSRGLRPRLATAWSADARSMRWRIVLRPNVKLHDGSALDSSQVVAALRASRPDWQATAEAGALVIEPGYEDPDLPWELADLRNAIAIHQSNGGIVGTGPFRMERLDAAGLTLRAHDDYWGGRPFVDTVQIRMGRSFADQLADLEGGRADMVSVQPADVRRLEPRQLRLAASRPLELFALVFEAPIATPAGDSLRRTLATAIDRSAIARVVLQGQGEPADALLPEWASGYGPLVLARTGQPLSRSALAGLPSDRRNLALRVVASDATAQAIAQRIAVNARDAGLALTVQAPSGLGPRFDLRMVRVPIEPTTPGRALAAVMAGLGQRTLLTIGRVPSPAPGARIDVVVRTERALLEHDIIIPIVHVPELYGLSPQFQSWNGPPVLPSGAWDLANAWLATADAGAP